ncbi:DUF429 domain-containing protein [Microvirga aerophila]|uniref:DUF429 domain-containing protein n=1 Tax=Microvirga aerophila TaxID=670291 RepID=A0A512C2W9_9HYPH|nr:DUF429 domain-containing protein [Microvirga aerophila]GEO18531.1 hypothetical protein MAE02_62270 [Microvirga aerophila]
MVPASTRFLNDLFAQAENGSVLAGFDFPIGVPSSYGRQTEASDFGSLLTKLGTGRWQDFFRVADSASEISVERPFYPRRSSAEAKQLHLINAHGVQSINDLRRRCEFATSDRRAACSLFWTLGGNQVGKAAIAGWQEVISPARQRGAKLWPFDGSLDDLARAGGLVIAETYPGEAYSHVGARFQAGESKRRQTDRASKANAIKTWASNSGVSFTQAMGNEVQGGFGNHATGEDRFDAALGLFGMIEVVSGHRPEGASGNDAQTWEGWILGQQA